MDKLIKLIDELDLHEDIDQGLKHRLNNFISSPDKVNCIGFCAFLSAYMWADIVTFKQYRDLCDLIIKLTDF